MGDIARRAVAINHPHGRRTGIRELVKDSGRDIHSLPALYGRSLLSQTHLAAALDDKINLFLFLVVPGYLPAIRFQRDMSEREMSGLNRTRSANQVLRAPAGRIGTARNLR